MERLVQMVVDYSEFKAPHEMDWQGVTAAASQTHVLTSQNDNQALDRLRNQPKVVGVCAILRSNGFGQLGSFPFYHHESLTKLVITDHWRDPSLLDALPQLTNLVELEFKATRRFNGRAFVAPSAPTGAIRVLLPRLSKPTIVHGLGAERVLERILSPFLGHLVYSCVQHINRRARDIAMYGSSRYYSMLSRLPVHFLYTVSGSEQ